MIEFLKKLLTPIVCGVVIDDKMVFGMDLSFAISAGSAQGEQESRCSTILDFGISNPDMGAGSPLWLTVQLVTSLDTIGVSTAEATWIEIYHANNVSTGGVVDEPITLMESARYKLSATCPASNVPGFKWINEQLPAHHGRYLQLAIKCVGDANASGTMDAFFHLGGMPAQPSRQAP